jgi:methylmalonyl-CoA mutase
MALERAWGRHRAISEAVRDVYAATVGERAPEIEAARRKVDAFRDADGRPPRILVAKLGQDGHDRGQKVIASAFADFGFEVVIGELFATPEEVAAGAAEAEVHVVGISSLTAGHLSHVPALRQALDTRGLPDVMIVVGGIIPLEDHAALRRAGVTAIFPPGTPIAEAAATLLDRLNERLGYAQSAAE